MKTKMVFYGDSIIKGKTWQENAPKPIDTKKNFVEYCRHCLDSFGIEVISKGDSTAKIICSSPLYLQM